MSAHSTYVVEFWYRHASDTDQTVRTHCQMTSFADTLEAVHLTIDGLRRQDYTVQRVRLLMMCATCKGNGRIGHAPKGMRKARVKTLPWWRVRWEECAACKGQGATDPFEMSL